MGKGRDQQPHRPEECWLRGVCLENDITNPPYCNQCIVAESRGVLA